MVSDVDKIIYKELSNRGKVTSDAVAEKANISRQAAHKRIRQLVREKKLLKIGKTRKSYYVAYSKEIEKEEKKKTVPLTVALLNKGLQEDLVFDKLAAKPGMFAAASKNAREIFRYAFTEMLNNAIEHSKSKRITLRIYYENDSVCFNVIDRGIGVYNNLMGKFSLKSEIEAVQELLKGKRTTDKKKHSGEGIFFTSKIADKFELLSSKTKLVIDNSNNDIVVEDIPSLKGTTVVFKLNKHTKKNLKDLFGEYTDEEFRFSKTKVVVKLYKQGVDYVSRSQARRILFGMDEFKTIELDFEGLKGIGQSFADEIFRVFKLEYPRIEIIAKNTSPAVEFMIKRVLANK